MAQYFGVRHFSPACAYFAEEFLNREKPDIVLIEGPSDLSYMIRSLCGAGSFLPAAILAYTEEAPVRTILYPFAEFSPEYAAMMWAVRNNIPVRFIDLPSDTVLAIIKEREENDEENADSQKRDDEDYSEKIHFSDDSFWEYYFEHNENYEDFIKSTDKYGKEIRDFSKEDKYNELREAFMRREISECEKQGKAAVITGAFHTYGLKDSVFSGNDENLLKKLPSVKSKATLMPYSYYRLSSRSGYGAGSKAPGYYEILWKNRVNNTLENTSAEYLSRLAAFQRKNGYAASSAEVIEALRLSDVLAKMRGGKYPSMDDLRDGAITCLGHGNFSEISVACADTEIGTKIGSLPEGTVCTSVQDDFYRQIKELKLERFRKASGEELSLDLRENLRVKSEKSAFLDLNRSFFLHRLVISGIHFGETTGVGKDNSTWSEDWKLRWSPETEIEIVEASLNGDTVKEAAEFSINGRLLKAENLGDTSKALSDAFLCGLEECIKTAASAVQKQAADCAGAADAGNAVGNLSEIIRFGSIRRLDSERVKPLISSLLLRFCLVIQSASVCDKAAADEIIDALWKVNDAVLSLDFLDGERFVNELLILSDSDMANPIISGFACAILLERGKISNEKLSELINRRLSGGFSPADAALWFEGLAMKNRRSLISRLSVWEKLCDFVSKLTDENDWKSALICLRRTFSQFSPSEKNDIAENIGEVLGIEKEAAAEFISSAVTEEEQKTLDELDDFDFGDI